LKWNLFSRKKQIHHADGVPNSYYTAGEVFDGGAERFVYNNEIPHPLVGFFGGIRVGEFRFIQPQTVYQNLALPVVPILPGIVPGQLVFNPLLDPNNLPNDANGAYLTSVFGGVQQ
jgi:hypothetical protein